MPDKILTYDRLREVLHYDPDTGKFTWLVRSAIRIKLGDVAGTLANGYCRIKIDGAIYNASRLAFRYMTGNWPADQMDHINHVRDDNRWINLRDVTHKENHLNRSKQKRNTSGATGVFWEKARNKWKPMLRIDGAMRHLGYYEQIWDAICARKSAEHKYGYHPNHGI